MHDDKQLLSWLKLFFKDFPKRGFTVRELSEIYEDATSPMIAVQIRKLLEEGYITEMPKPKRFGYMTPAYKYNFNVSNQNDIIKQFVTACKALKTLYPDVEITVRSKKDIPFD